MAEPQRLPREIESFIASCIDSVEQVEILLALRADALRRWTAEELSRSLHSSAQSVHLRLQRLVACGLVASEGALYVYGASRNTDDLVRRFLELYAHRRTAVIERIFSDSTDPMQSFADSFLLRRKADDDE